MNEKPKTKPRAREKAPRMPLVRILVLITTPKLAERAMKLYHSNNIPMHYRLNGIGTAPNEMMDILGLGSPEKSVFISVLSKEPAVEMLTKLRRGLKIGSVNSGIAFTLPVNGASKLILHVIESANAMDNQATVRKGENTMAENKYAMLLAIVNQGYSESVMNAARGAGAGGGTVLHSRRIGDESLSGAFGLSIQEEKEIVLIVTDTESKLAIMQAIGDECGVQSEAKGIVLSLPIENVIGLDNYD